MSYNSNSSSNESNKMEINNASNSKTTNEEQIEMTNTNSNNMSLDGGSTSSKLNTSPGTLSNDALSSSLCNSNKCTSSSSSDENTKPSKESTDSNNANINSFSSNNEDEDEEEEDEDDNNRYNSSNQSDEYRGETGGGGGSGEGGGSDSRALTYTDHEVTHTVSAYERLTKSVRSFLNATRILRTQLTQGSPESSAAEESSSNNQSLSPFSSASSASPPSSSYPSQSCLSPSMSSSSSNHHHYHHHASSSNSDKVKNMTKKSNLFDELLKQCSESSATNSYTNLSSNKKPSQKVNKTNLKNLINLFKNNENYNSTMFFPITDNFKLESSKTRYTFRSSTSHASRRASKKETEIKSNGEDSNELNECQFAYNKQQNQQAANDNNNNNNQSTNNNTDNNSAMNSNTTSNNSNSDTNTNQNNENNTHNTNVKLRSSEFFVCPICCHCLYEPITLVCGCSFCKSCLNEFNLTSIKLSLIKLAKKNAADSLNDLDLLANSTNYDMKQTCSNSQSCTEGTSSHKGDCNSDSEDSSESSNDDNSNNKSETKFKGLSCHNLGLFKCYNCSSVHENNTSEYLKANTNIASIVEKLFQSKVENRKLRNDIRRYICLNLENNNNNTSNKTKHFDVNKYEKMFLFAYSLDKTNHLILADLFLINYFSGRLDKALEYANKTAELRPRWAFSYFMKSIYYQKVGDLKDLRSNLIQCFQLDSSIEQIRYKIFQINYILLKPNHSQITDGKSALDYLKSKDMHSLRKRNKQAIDLTAIKRSFSFNNQEISLNESVSRMSKQLKVQSHHQLKKRYHSSDNDSKSFNVTHLNCEIKSNESFNLDDNETNESNEDSKQLRINSNLLSTNDLECSLCYRLFYNPVTTPCGHSYCCSCLERSLDYQDKCPLCKNSLAEVYLAERRQNLTVFLDSLTKNFFPKEYEIRKKQYLDELKELTNNENEIPVFVCTTALPFASCPLHIYEPRYRLMLRRAIESGSKQFGMCMYSEMTPYHYTEYGCMLEIRNYQFTRDGRAVVATVGGKRFKVIRAYMKDGYNVAQIEWVNDVRETNEEEIQELQGLHDKTYQLALKWYRLIPEIQKQKILEIYGEMPPPETDIQSNDNGPVWHWFLLNILPLENDFQYKFLTKISLKERLKQIKKLLIFMLLIDRSRQQMTTSTSSQNIYSLQDSDVDPLANFNTNRSRSSNGIDSDAQPSQNNQE